ncbi:MAG: hypothetical protein WKF61_02185, partial [Luteimonas sp.]
FPRRRESSDFAFQVQSRWIPAFAGMTIKNSGDQRFPMVSMPTFQRECSLTPSVSIAPMRPHHASMRPFDRSV